MLADSLREFIEANQYEYVDLGHGCFRLRFGGKNGDYQMFAHAGEDPGQILVFTCCPVKMPEDRRGAVADYVNRVNYGLAIGCLEIDPEDGEVRSRASAPVAPDGPGAGVLGPLFDASYYLIENWLLGLLRVAFGSQDPATAYAAQLDALSSDHAPQETAADTESVEESGSELTPIEQEVSQLLAERDSYPESPASD